MKNIYAMRFSSDYLKVSSRSNLGSGARRAQAILSLALICAASLWLASCAAMAPDLTGDPSSSALVVVDGTFQTKGLLGENRTAPATQSTLGNGHGVIGTHAAFKGHTVFTGVAPGRYFVANVTSITQTQYQMGNQVRTETQTLGMNVSPQLRSQIPGLSFDVAAGQVVYVGSLDVHYTTRFLKSPTIDSAELNKTPESERGVWQEFVGEPKYKTSPWLQPIQSRLAELSK